MTTNRITSLRELLHYRKVWTAKLHTKSLLENLPIHLTPHLLSVLNYIYNIFGWLNKSLKIQRIHLYELNTEHYYYLQTMAKALCVTSPMRAKISVWQLVWKLASSVATWSCSQRSRPLLVATSRLIQHRKSAIRGLSVNSDWLRKQSRSQDKGYVGSGNEISENTEWKPCACSENRVRPDHNPLSVNECAEWLCEEPELHLGAFM